MSAIIEIEQAIEKLSPDDLQRFGESFAERNAAEWDRQFKQDVAAGRLDALGEAALAELREERCTDFSSED